jgi:hypothetical protein
MVCKKMKIFKQKCPQNTGIFFCWADLGKRSERWGSQTHDVL